MLLILCQIHVRSLFACVMLEDALTDKKNYRMFLSVRLLVHFISEINV